MRTNSQFHEFTNPRIHGRAWRIRDIAAARALSPDDVRSTPHRQHAYVDLMAAGPRTGSNTTSSVRSNPAPGRATRRGPELGAATAPRSAPLCCAVAKVPVASSEAVQDPSTCRDPLGKNLAPEPSATNNLGCNTSVCSKTMAMDMHAKNGADGTTGLGSRCRCDQGRRYGIQRSRH